MNNTKNTTIIKIALSILIGIAGILTVIFSILNLANVKTIPSDAVLRILAGVILIVIGTSFGLFTLFAKGNNLLMNLIVSSLLLGVGIFMFFETSFLDTIVSFIFPLIVACFGGLMLIKGIADGIKRQHNFILTIIFGTLLLVTGVLFTIYHNQLENVVWLLLGIAVVVLSIIEIIYTLKGQPKVKILNNK